MTVRSVNNTPIRLTDERWRHIAERHPELREEKDAVIETICNPTLIQEGDFGTLMAVRTVGHKYLVVVYRELNETDGFVITAYFAEELSKRRKVIWKT